MASWPTLSLAGASQLPAADAVASSSRAPDQHQIATASCAQARHSQIHTCHSHSIFLPPQISTIELLTVIHVLAFAQQTTMCSCGWLWNLQKMLCWPCWKMVCWPCCCNDWLNNAAMSIIKSNQKVHAKL
jgi:hypothetical protein